MANTIYSFFPDNVLETDEKTSSKREIFIAKQRQVDVRFEFQKEEAFERFHKLSEDLLPQLPKGYQWVKSNGKYGVIRHEDSVEHEISILIYGPNSKGVINFLCCRDNVTFYSFANTQKKGAPAQRDYPLSNKDYNIDNYDYGPKRFKNHIRGHMIDHHDTILELWNSSKDIRNYTPEPPIYEWGMGIRRLATADLRTLKYGGAYAQYNIYGSDPFLTANGTPVPDKIRFFTYQCKERIDEVTRQNLRSYEPLDLYHVNFNESLEKPVGRKILEHAKENFCSDWESAPTIKAYQPKFTDSALRLLGRNMCKQALSVSKNNTASRFADDDYYDLTCMSADYEFEKCSQRLRSALLSDKQNFVVHTVNYCNSSLNYAEALLELDLKKPKEILNLNVRNDAQSFFKKAQDERIVALADKFQQICSNMDGR